MTVALGLVPGRKGREMLRKSIDKRSGERFIVEVEGKRFPYTECYVFAEIGNMPANIHDSVLRTRDGQFIRITVVADAGNLDPHGVRSGWYTAYRISSADADKLRKSWAVLCEQPVPPSGPWR